MVNKTAFFTFLFSIITLCYTSIQSEQSPLAIHAAQKYMASFVITKTPFPQPYSLSLKDTQEAAFYLLLNTRRFHTDIIDISSVNKLEIIGGGENIAAHLVGKIFNKYINTTIGMAQTVLTFCHPTKNISVLKDRQYLITKLSNNQPLVKELDTALRKIKFTERKTLMFWHPHPPVDPQSLKITYWGGIFGFNPLKRFNLSPIALEIGNKIADIAIFTRTVADLRGTLPEFLPTLGGELGKVITYLKDPLTWFSDIVESYFLNKGKKETKILMAPFFEILALYKMYSNINFYNPYHDVLITTAAHINTLRKIGTILNKDAITHKENSLVYRMPSLQSLVNLANKKNTSDHLNQLLDLFETGTFTGTPSFFSYTGRILVAYKLMQKVRKELALVFAAAGELDMYLACTKIYNEHKGKNAQYCIADFIESETPVIDARKFWNPFVDPDTVVVNDALLDKNNPNYILTGPNTGGKSTVIKAVLLNLLMALTFGIAPSEKLIITPFSKFNCFMNISDDIGLGASLFKAEVMRAKKLLDMVQNLKKGEFSFIIIDEVFTGTSPVEGEIAAMRFAKRLAQYPNNVSIIATHYAKMINLEAETKGLYRNYHIEIVRNPDGSLNRTFKLKRGPSLINVALDILKEEGMDL